MLQNKNYKPFDIEKAKAGAKLITRCGRPARIICWDREYKTDHIVALVMYTEDGETPGEEIVTYTDQGTFYAGDAPHNLDLFLAPTIVEKWMNVYRTKTGEYYNGMLYDSEEEALQHKDGYLEYITATKISWEE